MRTTEQNNTIPISPSIKRIKIMNEVKGYLEMISKLRDEKKKMEGNNESQEDINKIKHSINLYESARLASKRLCLQNKVDICCYESLIKLIEIVGD
jgi:hypothetical protein